MFACRRRYWSFEDAKVRAVFVGQDVEVAVIWLGKIKEVFAGGNANRWGVSLHVLEEDFGLGPALLDHNAEPAAVVRQSCVRPILRVTSFTENERVLRGITAQRVIEDVPVIHLLAVCNIALLRIARVIETAIIGLPRYAGGARALDGIGQQLAGASLDDAQRAHLGAAFGRAVSDKLSIVRWLPPIQRHRSSYGKRVDIQEHFVFAVDVFTNVEDGLVLLALAAGVEVILAADFRSAEIADLDELLNAVVQLVAAGQLVEDAARIGQLRQHPLLRFGSTSILQPAVRINNLVAEVIIGDGLLFGRGGLGNVHRRRVTTMVVLR